MAGSPPHRPTLTFALLLCGFVLQAAALSLKEVHAPVYRKRGSARSYGGQKEEVGEYDVEPESLSGMYSAATARKVARFLKELEQEMAQRESLRVQHPHLEKKGGAPSSYPTRIFSHPRKKASLPQLAVRDERKRSAARPKSAPTADSDQDQRGPGGEPAVLGELQSILRDEEVKKVPPDVKRQETHDQKKRQSEVKKPSEKAKETFNDWVQREYHRNLARSFASMRRKRSGWSSAVQSRLVEGDSDQFQEVTDKLKAIENALLTDALNVIQRGTDVEDATNKISNDLNAAYDLETMRIALSHLKDTLARMDDSEEETPSREEPHQTVEKKSDDDNNIDYPPLPDTYSSSPVSSALQRGDIRKGGATRCPPLNLLTSDCSALSDVMMDGALRDLMLYSCNWHEVCYSCGEAFGLTAEDCDVGFVEESRTICEGDVPCQTTAELMLVPLRQRRVFYKRSNPAVCYVDPCVLEFLRKD